MVFGVGDLFCNGFIDGAIGTRREYVRTGGGVFVKNRDDLVGGLALTVDDLCKPASYCAMVIQLGETQILKRQRS